MSGRDLISQIMLISGAAIFIGMGVFAKSFYRKSLRCTDPHPTRVRVALIALGLALLVLWFSEYAIPK